MRSRLVCAVVALAVLAVVAYSAALVPRLRIRSMLALRLQAAGSSTTGPEPSSH